MRGEVIVSVVLSTLVFVFALAALPGMALSQQPLQVVTTSADLKSLASAVGGARVVVESLAAPEQDPHTIELKPGQLARVRSAALLIRVGLDHEPWIARLKLPPNVTVLDASANVRLTHTQTPRLRAERRAHVHAFGNTHYWLDPDNAVPITAAIRDALVMLSPKDAGVFDANRTAFLQALTPKIGQWKKALAPYRGARLVVIHDSWSYFAEAFGLELVAAAEGTPGVPPSPAELAALFGRMRDTGVRVFKTDPHTNPALVRQLSERTGAQPVVLSPSGHHYIPMMEENVSRLVEALRRARS